jgi:hypothetical protein
MEPKFTIANDFDPDGDMPANADPMAEYLTYLADVRGSAAGDMGFTSEDFKRYIAGLRKHGRHGEERQRQEALNDVDCS